jgi:hypothetical protein
MHACKGAILRRMYTSNVNSGLMLTNCVRLRFLQVLHVDVAAVANAAPVADVVTNASVDQDNVLAMHPDASVEIPTIVRL